MSDEEPRKYKVYRIVLFHLDTDHLGPKQLTTMIQEGNLGNHVTAGHVMSIEEATVHWTDEHPLNMRGTQQAAFKELFPNPIIRQLIDSYPDPSDHTESEHVSDLRHWAETVKEQLEKL